MSYPRDLQKFMLLVISILISKPCLANDTVLQGIGGGDVMPLQDMRLVMQSEEITMTLINEHDVKVEAIYRFKNLTKEKIKVDLGFPELSCQKDEDEAFSDGRQIKEAALVLCGQKKEPKFRNFETWVNQQRVNYQIVSTKATKVRALSIPPYEVVYAYTVSFEPEQEIEVRHQYQLIASESMGKYFAIYYLTQTGNFWARPIGKAIFKFRHHVPLISLSFPKEYLLKTVKKEYLNQKYQVEFHFEMDNWLPAKDLLLSYQLLSPQSLAMNLGDDQSIHCPMTSELTRFDEQELKNILENPSLDRNRDKIQKCINLIYAHYGYPFKNKDIKASFYQEDGDPLKGIKKLSNCDQDPDCYFNLTLPLSELSQFNEKAISLENQFYIKYLKKVTEALKK